ncbi:hypothetical protein LEP1GSC036_4470 [Leptospira weilii str. 2006001853]|uniref:Uncharacterized protein n=1 Tax=Leptospira weilii str. 2006001853 TaxID=1001589 RepID=A0A828YWC8_9LEPT|nr:hypothetical protein LEP1GSC036_4470 [Leptospira weilii str. 2006001853]EMN46456.1 hypothetical protein LEP1GSC086_3052 [Leptospira weilii str. LNT 1234]
MKQVEIPILSKKKFLGLLFDVRDRFKKSSIKFKVNVLSFKFLCKTSVCDWNLIEGLKF